MTIRKYKGVSIYPVTSKGIIRVYGARWEAHVNRPLYADTLEGIKRLIREAVTP